MSLHKWPLASKGASITLLLAALTACNSSKSLDRKTAEKLTKGQTIDSPRILIHSGLAKEILHDANAIRAFHQLADAGILRCNPKLTECRSGPRALHLVNEGSSGIRVIIGYLSIDDVSNLTQVDAHSAKADASLTFKPTPNYLKYHDAFKSLTIPSESAQADSDGTATVLFHLTAKGWAVEDVAAIKKTGTTAWKAPRQEDSPSGPLITNLARLATVSVSSENTEAGQLGANAINGEVADFSHETPEWASRGEVEGAWIKLTWPSQVEVWEVVLYDRPNLRDNIGAGVLIFSDGTQINVGPLPNDGAPFRVEFDPRTVTWIQFKIVNSTGGHPGLQEFEVFGTKL